ncbi:bifunctional DNA primase/polymerase [Tunturiibacter lichenicola]|uniref:bifunctional DNA primase/polymerase n=1 Tax=Tunturiibacter lichenicola TaxID=2051959 RepID=UPI003D9B7827
MKTPPDFFLEYGKRVPAPPASSSFNQTRCSADLPIEVLQASRLWRLFPVWTQSRLASGMMRIEDATADRAQLEQWACEHPGCNWGLATGAASGVFVLEVDTRRAGSALRILCDDVWDWQQTLQMSAGDAGYAFFRWPAGRAMRRSGKNPAPGIRIHGEGDYVLIPPSACSSGVSNVYLDPDAAIAAAPQWLLDSVFAGSAEQPSGRILAFPKFPLQKVSTTTRPPGLSLGKLLPFVAHASFLPDPHARHRVYMSFQFCSNRWWCQFLDDDFQTLLPRMVNLATTEELVALVDRGSGLSNLQSRQALDLAIATGRGGIFLSLTADQYKQLQKHRRSASASSNAELSAFSLPTGLQNAARTFE